MKLKKLLFILLLIIPIDVFAFAPTRVNCDSYNFDTRICTLSVCNDGCSLDKLVIPGEVYYQDEIFNNRVDTLIINMEQGSYDYYGDVLNARIFNNVIINGNNSTLKQSYPLLSIKAKSIEIYDLNIPFSFQIDIDDGESLTISGGTYKRNSDADFAIKIDESHYSGEIMNSTAILKNTSIEGLEITTISEPKVTVDNANLLNGLCSLTFLKTFLPASNKNSSLSPMFLSSSTSPSQLISPNEINVFVSNSQLNCVRADATDGSLPVNIYIDGTNKWEEDYINRNDNVQEIGDSYIYIEKASTEEVLLNSNNNIDLEEYFDNNIDPNDVYWEIEDATIATIRDNKIVPLKVGSTTITGKLNRNYYKILLTVREDVVTPTPTATPVVEPTPNATLKPTEPVKDEDVKVPDTYAFSLIMVLIAIVVSATSAFYLSKEEN